MSTSYDNHLSYFACYYDQMKPVTQRILHRCFMYFAAKKKDGEIKEIFPSIKKIAKISKCGTTSVKKSIKEIVEQFPDVLKVTKKINRKSNHYELNDKMFEFLALLQACRYEHRWKEVRERVLVNLSEDENYLAKIICRKGELSTEKVSTSQLSKVSTIKSSLMNSKFRYIRTEERTQIVNNFEDNSNNFQKNRSFGWIQDLPISERDKLYICHRFDSEQIRKARQDYDWYSKKQGKIIYNPSAFMQSRAKRH